MAKPRQPGKRALTDKQVRAHLQAEVDAGRVAKETQTGVESTLRQSRREVADYNKAHVHVGAEPRDDHGAPAVIVEAQAEQPAPARIPADVERRAARNVKLEQRASAHERDMRTDTRQAQSPTDRDGPRLSASASQAGPDPGPHYRQTEGAARGRADAAEHRADKFNLLAWPFFTKEHPTEAGEIERVWTHAEKQELSLPSNDPDAAFAKAADSRIRKNVSGAQAQAARRVLLAGCWRTWRDFREAWRREHPDATLPRLPGERHLSENPNKGPEAIGEIVAGVRAAIHEADPLEAAWEAQGRPSPRGFACLQSLEERLRQVEQATRWEENPLRLAAIRNRAVAEYYERFREWRPRSLIPE